MSIPTYKNSKDRIIQSRSLYPAAFALSVNEALRLDKIDKTINKFFDNNREFIQYIPNNNGYTTQQLIFNDDSIALLKVAIKGSRSSLKNTCKLANRVLKSKWFTVIPNNNILYFRTDTTPQTIADRDKYPELYEYWDKHNITITRQTKYSYAAGFEHNPESLRAALYLDQDYKYLSYGEYDTLQLIIEIAEYKSEPFTTDYLPIKNTPEVMALTRVGRKSYNESIKRYDEMNETDILSLINTAGVKIVISGREIKPHEFVLMGKTLELINNAYTVTGFKSEWVTLTVDECMDYLGISDRKRAKELLKKAADNLIYTTIEPKDGSKLNLIEATKPIKNGILILLGRNLYNSLKPDGRMDYRPKSLGKLLGNTWKIANTILTLKRNNLGNPNENRVRIATLLKDMDLPTESDITPNRYKQQIVEPFYTHLNNAADTLKFKWDIVKPNGVTLTPIEKTLAMMDYNEMIKYLIQFTWIREPEEYEHIRAERVKNRERKSADKDKAKTKRKSKS